MLRPPLLQLSSAISLVAALPGCAYGLSQPTLVLRHNGPFPAADWVAIDALMEEVLPGLADFGPVKAVPEAALSARVLAWAAELQRSAALPVMERGRILMATASHAVLAAPAAAERSSLALASLRLAAFLADHLVQTPEAELVAKKLPIAEALAASRAQFNRLAPTGTNMPRFLGAAAALRIPFDLMSKGTYQFGWGVHSRWLESTWTDRSSNLGVRLARDKVAAAQVLRRVGLPAPEHHVVATEDAAIAAAATLGYPVVVKPADLDGGVGVAANLKAPEKVRAAFAAAKAHSHRIIVEKHAPGHDYRLIMFNGRLLWSVIRHPGGVTGDGMRSVRALVEILNQDPRRGTGSRSFLKKLILDREAEELLAESGMTIESVPPAGLFVRLRSAANISMGGIATAINEPGQVHPDNRRLVEAAARAFRLDLAGVDLIMEDISRSWLEIGGVICEVNSQPQLGYTTQTHLYGEILSTIVPVPGRIPVAVMVGGDKARAAARLVERAAQASGRIIGVASAEGSRIGGLRIGGGGSSLFAASRMILSSAEVEAALVLVEDTAVLSSGLPMDRYDLLVLADGMAGADQRAVDRVLGMIGPNNAGAVLSSRDEPAYRHMAGVQEVAGDPAAIAAAIESVFGGRPAALAG